MFYKAYGILPYLPLFLTGAHCTLNQQQKLTAPDGAEDAYFGFRTVMTNNTIIITAYKSTIGQNDDQGSAYTYTQSGPSWSFLQQLTASDGAANDYFGISASTYAVYLAVGAYWADIDGVDDAGAVYLFEQNENSFLFSQIQKTTAPDGEPGDSFGYSVAVSDNVLLAGAPFRDVADNANQGCVYVFEYEMFEFSWSYSATLLNSGGKVSDFFGVSLSVCACAVLAGSNLVDNGDDENTGAAYLYKQDPSNGNAWTQYQKIIADDSTTADNFAGAIAVSDDCKALLIGAFGDNENGHTDEGSAYYFAISDTLDSYTQEQKLTPLNGSSAEYFGFSVSLTTTYGSTTDNNRFVIGGYYYDTAVGLNAGAAYVFDLKENGNYAQNDMMLAADGTSNDEFGYSVACSYNTVVVGAPGDDVLGEIDQGSAYMFDSSASPPTAEPTSPPDVSGKSSGGDDDGLNDGETAAVVIVVLAVAGVIGFVAYRQSSRKKKSGQDGDYQSMDKTVLLTQSRMV